MINETANLTKLTIEQKIQQQLRNDEAAELHPLIVPDFQDWPIHQLTKNKEAFIQELTDDTLQLLKRVVPSTSAMEELLAKVVYLENIRLKQDPWKTDTKEEKAFWKNAKQQLLQRSLENQENLKSEEEYDYRIFRDIIETYSTEILGNFSEETYKFASKALPFGFNRLLNTASSRSYKRIWSNQFRLTERIKTFGYADEIRNLAKKGTIILVPTHHSNLDSILIGWAIHCIGLPALQYGAGLNLYSNPIMAYFFDRLGSYKIDRRKKNLIYLETLKNYSRLTVQRGLHTLFFPGGTRSRSGQLETRLKLGLLGTVMDAQRLNFQKATNANPAKKLFVVPMVINYHFVLEASSLIENHLKKKGQEKYFVGKSSIPSTKKTSKFMWKFFSQQSEVLLSLGKPMDLFGNDLDEEGNSINRHGELVDIRSYFVSNGEITADFQRDSEYTRMMGQEIIKRFYRENIVLSSHLVAFTAFEILNKKHRSLDLYGLLRLPEEDRIIPYNHFLKVIENVRNRLFEMEKNHQLRLSKNIFDEVEELIKHGIQNLGVFHPKQALKQNKKGYISSENLNLLYFYHNRLKGYDLETFV